VSQHQRLLSYVLRHRRAFLIGFGLSLLNTALMLVNPWILRQAVDGIRAGTPLRGLFVLAGVYVAVALGGGVIRFFWRVHMMGAGRRIETEIRGDFFGHLQRLDQRFFQHARTGDLMARGINDLNAVSRLASAGIMHMGNTLITFVATSALMLTVDVRLASVILVILPLVTIVFVLLGRRIHVEWQGVQQQFSAISARAQENFSGIRVVKAFAQEDAEIEALAGLNREYVHRVMRLSRLSGALWPSMTFILGLAAAAVLWQGGLAVVAGRLTLGQLVQFFGYLMMLSWPMIALGWTTNLFQQGLASMSRIDEILDTRPAVADPAAPVVRERLRGEIEFKGVAVAYTREPVLRDINLKIPAGSTVAIVGPTGAGKTTLVSLLPRLFDVTAGSVRVDGVDVREYSLETLRGNIGMVPQEPFLFSDTLEGNLALGVGAGDGMRVSAAAEVAQLAKDVRDFPLGYQTIVGERGVTLSGGQKQRATIARALARDPAILILDDALSSVDTRTEDEILQGLRRFMATRTSIIISHRISTVRHADQIVVVDDGHIVERGTHDELLVQGGLYADLYQKQLLQDALDADEALSP
jgi:ATP-binding cassette subfamily B protein